MGNHHHRSHLAHLGRLIGVEACHPHLTAAHQRHHGSVEVEVEVMVVVVVAGASAPASASFSAIRKSAAISLASAQASASLAKASAASLRAACARASRRWDSRVSKASRSNWERGWPLSRAFSLSCCSRGDHLTGAPTGVVRSASDRYRCHNQRLSLCRAAAMAEPLARSSACSVGVSTRASQLSGSSARGQASSR